MVFDNRLSFIPHLKNLRTRCMKALNLLRVVGHKDWGSNFDLLLILYRCLVRSKLDYGCMIYGSARKSYIQMLDPIQNQALRICLGAFRTSPVESLQAEANEPPLFLRRQKLAVQFALQLCSNKTIPTFKHTFNTQFTQKFINKPNAIQPFGLRIKNLIQNININLEQIINNHIISIPPWLMYKPNVFLDLHNNLKSNSNANILKQDFLALRGKFQNCVDLIQMAQGQTTEFPLQQYAVEQSLA